MICRCFHPIFFILYIGSDFQIGSGCDARCGCGYTFTTRRLGHWGHHSYKPVSTLNLCAKKCNERNGCTGFRYAHEGAENYNCKTYTGGTRTISNVEEGSGWTNCVKGEFEFHGVSRNHSYLLQQ